MCAWQATAGDAPEGQTKAGLRAGGSFWQAPSWRLDRAEAWAANKGKSKVEARWAYIACVQVSSLKEERSEGLSDPHVLGF